MDYRNYSKILRTNSPPESSSNRLLFQSCNQFEQCFPGLDMMKHRGPVEMMASSNIIIPPSMERDMLMMNQEKMKRRLTTNQLESLESSFQEEKKLDPDRKIKLARDLGLQPRQIAVWFQNRRARWKAKKLENLYDTLKIEFDVVSKEKQMLQQEVQRLQSMLMEQAATKKQVYSSYTDASCCDETVESTSTAAAALFQVSGHHHKKKNVVADSITLSREHNKEGQFIFNAETYNAISSSYYWGAMREHD